MTELAALLAASSLGAMIFFSAFIAPAIFRVLPEADAGRLLRSIFPNYFLANGSLALIAAVVAAQPLESGLLALCGMAMVGVWAFAIPVINAARDQMLAGDEAASIRFARWHGGTVGLNVLEMIGLTAAIFLLFAADDVT